MKTILNICLLLFIVSSSFSQQELDKPYVHWVPGSSSISMMNLRNGELIFTTPLKEPVISRYYNAEKEALFVQTKHFSYKIDASNGNILVEFQFVSSTLKNDPDVSIAPLYYDENGIGLYHNMQEQVDNQLKGNGNTAKLYRFDTENQKIEEFGTHDFKKYAHLMGLNNKLYLFHQFESGNDKFIIDVSPTDKYSVEQTYVIPIDLSDNTLDLTLNQIENVTVAMYDGKSFIKDNVIHLTLTKGFKTETFALEQYNYNYDYANKKRYSLEKFDLNKLLSQLEFAFDCVHEYTQELVIPEIPLPPAEPEIFKPINNRKKARAEADQINAERLKEYQKKYKKWSEASLNSSQNSANLYRINGEEKELIKTFEGISGISFYEDRYAFYMDELEYVLFDVISNKIVWSNLR